MSSIFVVTFPFFALVLAGYVATRRRLVPLEAIPGLNAFVLLFALPCMLYKFASNTPIVKLLDPGAVLTWFVAASAIVGGCVVVARRRGANWRDAAFCALAASFPNSGFMGVPLLVALQGASAAGPAIVTMAIDMTFTTSLCIALSQLGAVGDHGMRRAVAQAMRGMLRNPLPWSIVLGSIASATGRQLPGPAFRTLSMLADAASPAALFTIGAVLARSRLLAASPAAAPARWGDDGLLVVLKAVAHPLLVLALGAAAIAAHLPLERGALVILVLTAALPSASNVPMLAERFGADAGRVARIVLATTIVSFLSFPLAVSLLS